MKKYIGFLLLIFLFQEIMAQTSFIQYPVYQATDLGLTYSSVKSAFRIWSPPAEEAMLSLYKDGEHGDSFQSISMEKGIAGTWHVSLPGGWKGFFYTVKVKINNHWSNEVTDPYAKATGVNGKRALIADLRETDPPGWEAEKSPAFSKQNLPTDAIIYELHVRDASISSSSGIKHKGKFIGLAELGTLSEDGLATGLSHLKELGVTHVHLLPFYDYNSVDESKPGNPEYNWGYDPLNYNVPEGSYSTNPFNGLTRIRELKEMIGVFHKNGLRVIFDAVYNHTALSEQSNFNQLVPGYYYRHKKDSPLEDLALKSSFSDATACGNETASELPMIRKFMLESLLYWVEEYHVDGFRFDLMGVHDIMTMNAISAALHEVKPDILLYGEGWAAGASPVPDSLRALKKNAYMLDRIAVFSDDIRDGIKGSVFEHKERGFASGAEGKEESVKFGIVASCKHPQISYSEVNYSKAPYAQAPGSVITYCECHDNHTLYDKLAISCPDATPAERKKMQLLSLTIILTSQGIPFLHAGTEFLRSKQGVENSYKSGDIINAIDWSLKKENHDVFSYVKALIDMRKAHPSFRMLSATSIAQNIHFDETAPLNTIVYRINGSAMQDRWKHIFVAFNGSDVNKKISIPPGKWKPAIHFPGTEGYNGKAEVPAYSALILYQD